MAMAAASSLFRRVSAHIGRIPPRAVLPSTSISPENVPPPSLPESPFSMDLMAVPKKKVSKYKKGLRNGPRALKPVPVIVRCKGCGRVKLPHFYCCSGERGVGNTDS
ncbi:uncharacterized protein M6B38_232305 [Iris pallida]|uniref:Large ribosomal subunit protein bL32m n=1 Tax=Iris pallida TaxID=29817 RepID=A0AAX6DRT6_IRIPA|nr:uncharacterized protein M6B38_232305 [Iris pallida]